MDCLIFNNENVCEMFWIEIFSLNIGFNHVEVQPIKMQCSIYLFIFSISAIQQAFLFQKHLALFYFTFNLTYVKVHLKSALSWLISHYSVTLVFFFLSSSLSQMRFIT